MATTGSADVSNVIETRVSEIVTSTLIQNSVMMGAVSDFSSQATPGVDEIDIPLFNELAVQSVVEGTALTPQTINPSANKLALDRQRAIPFSITRKAGVQTKIELVPRAIENGARSLAAEMDDYMLGLLDANAARQALDGTDPLKDIAAAKKFLDDANVMKTGRYLVASPGFIQSLIQNTNIIRESYYGNRDAVVNGFVTRVFGFDILESSSSSIIDDGFHAYHVEGMAFARQIMPGLETEDRALLLQRDYVLHHLYGAKEVDAANRAVVFDADGL